MGFGLGDYKLTVLDCGACLLPNTKGKCSYVNQHTKVEVFFVVGLVCLGIVFFSCFIVLCIC